MNAQAGGPLDGQFGELSRKAARGTLTAAEREWLDALVAREPGRRADLDWDAAFVETLDEKVAALPAMPGWERTERALADQQQAGARHAGETGAGLPGAPEVRARTARERGDGEPGILDRLADWLAGTLGVPVNAQAAAVALILVQAGAIVLLATPSAGDEEAIRTGTQHAAPRGPLLRVSFRPDVREADLRRALADVGGEIVGGPGQLGVYLVRVREGDLAESAARLRAGGSVELVEIVGAAR
jgi:hypothetical protein